MSDTPRCKEQVTHYIGSWPQNPVGCSRPASKDGYCKQHHPAAVKARREAAQAKFDAALAKRRAPIDRIMALERELTAEKQRSERLEKALRAAAKELRFCGSDIHAVEAEQALGDSNG